MLLAVRQVKQKAEDMEKREAVVRAYAGGCDDPLANACCCTTFMQQYTLTAQLAPPAQQYTLTAQLTPLAHMRPTGKPVKRKGAKATALRVQVEEEDPEASAGLTPTPMGQRRAEYGRDKRKRKVRGRVLVWRLAGALCSCVC